MRKILFALAAQAVAVGAVSAQEARPAVAPIVPCPPNVVLPTLPCPPGSVPGVMPGTPGAAPVTPINPEVPGTPPGTVPPPVASSDLGGGFARQSEGGTQVAQSFAPNMFGDILGPRATRVTYTVPFAARFAVAGNTTTAGGPGVIVNPNGAGGAITFGPLPNGQTRRVPASFNNGDLTFTQPTVGGTAAYDREFARSALQTLLSQSDLTPAQQAAFNQLTPAQQAQILRNRGAVNTAITQATRGLSVQSLTVGPLGGDINGGFIDYTGSLTGEQVIALPSAGGTVGRIKMAEDNSPIPRDRFIFVYDNFDAVPYTPNGIAVNRYQFGVEKTFWDGRWSAEFRLPFASSLAASTVQGFESTNTELGNVRFALKRIYTQNQVFTTSGGVAVTLPTAADQVAVSSLDGSELYRFNNRSVTIEPFIAALYTPNSRVFSQTWASVNVDVSGGEGSTRVWDLPILTVSHQFGFWLVQRDTGLLRGLAPFVELHWNYTIAQNELVKEVNKRSGDYGLAVQAIATNELNLTTGIMMMLGNNWNVGVGASAPLLQKPDRTFDAQVGVRASYLFGRSAQARNPIYAISGF